MRVSLNEIQLTTRKAVQGCGLPYGLAEEAAVAVRALSRWGLAPVPLFVETLAAGGYENSALYIGPSLADRLATEPGGLLHLSGVTSAALLPGYLAGRSVRLGWRDACYVLSAGKLCRAEPGGDRAPVDVTAEIIEAGTPSPAFALAWDSAPVLGVDVETDAWRRLQAYGARILTPETDYSRRHGAGAGLIDTD